jgi:hypothetical protein
MLNIDGNDLEIFKEFQPKGICYTFVATAIIGAGVLSAGAGIYAATKASSAQEQATATAASIEKQQLAQTEANFNTSKNNLQPYIDAGTGAQTTLTNELPNLTSPVVMNESALQQTPGYQFNLTQGLKAVQNSAAARGLGVSGAALKGASAFATGLADSTYQNQFSNAVTNQTNAYNRLLGVVQTGAGAAGNLAGAATGTSAVETAGAGQIGGSVIAGGNAAAAGANATGSAISSAANSLGGYALIKGLYGAGSAQGPAQTTYEGNYNTAANP